MAFFLPPTASGFEFKGFSDVTFTAIKNEQKTADLNTNSRFALGQFDLYISHTIGDRVDILSEMVVESNEEGEFGVDLERLQVSYLFSDALSIRAGRFHNILGYWNTTYHHGAQMQTTIERPQFLRFEDDGGILPVHLVGLWAKGRLDAAPGALEYGFMVGNGPKISGIDLAGGTAGALDPNNIADNNTSKAISAHLEATPSWVDGLSIGVSGNFSKVQFFDSTGKPISIAGNLGIRQTILGANLEYLANSIELLVEFYHITDHDAKTFQNHAWYVQGGYKIANRFTPYVRFERVTVDEDDPYFTALGTTDLKKTITGIRYDIILTSSLKAEVRFVNDTDSHQEYAIQWAFAF